MRTILTFLITVSLLSTGGDFSGRFLDAVQAFSHQDYRQARKLFTSLAAEKPDDDAVFYYLGMCNFYLSDAVDAETFLKEAVRLDSLNDWYRESLAQLYYGLGRVDETVAMYESLLERNPRKTDYHYALVSLYAHQGRFDKVLSTLDDIETVVGKDETVALARYDILSRQGRLDDAYAVLEEYNREFGSPQIICRMADHQMAQYRDSAAFALYDEALSYDSSYAPALLGKAELYRAKKELPRYFEAIGELVEQVDVPAQMKSEYFARMLSGVDPRFVKDNEAVLDTLLRRMTRLYPDDLLSEGNYVQFLGAMGRWSSMAVESEDGYSRFPDKTGFLSYLAIACYNLQDTDGFLDANRRIIAAAPSDTAAVVEAWASIGDMYHALGDKKQCYKAYESALKIVPDYLPVLNNYAYFLALERRKLKKAFRMSSVTVEREPDNPTYLDTYGWLLYLLKRPADAKPVFKHAMIYGGKDSPECLTHYGIVLDALGEHDAAQVYYNLAKSRKK